MYFCCYCDVVDGSGILVDFFSDQCDLALDVFDSTEMCSVKDIVLLVGQKLSELDRRVVVVGIGMEGEGFVVKNVNLLLEFDDDIFGGFEVDFDAV